MASCGGRSVRAAAVIAAAAATACGLSVVGGEQLGAEPDDASMGQTADASLTDATRPRPAPDAPADDGASPDGRSPSLGIYVNTTKELYRVDGTTGAATLLFTFGGSCAGNDIGDIAIDRAGAMFAVTLPSGNKDSELHRVDRATGACAPSLGNLGVRCAALAFAPSPTDASQDALYAGCTASLYRVEPSTGAASSVGQFGGGLGISGDIVWFPGQGLFATLTTGSGNDRLSRIDPASGAATTVAADTGATALFGLAYHGSVLIAFGNEVARTIDPVSGATAPLASALFAYGATTGL